MEYILNLELVNGYARMVINDSSGDEILAYSPYETIGIMERYYESRNMSLILTEEEIIDIWTDYLTLNDIIEEDAIVSLVLSDDEYEVDLEQLFKYLD